MGSTLTAVDIEKVPGLVAAALAIAPTFEVASCGNVVDPIGGSTGLEMLGETSGLHRWRSTASTSSAEGILLLAMTAPSLDARDMNWKEPLLGMPGRTLGDALTRLLEFATPEGDLSSSLPA